VLDDLEVRDIRPFETQLHEWFQARHTQMLDDIRNKGTLPEGDTLADAVAEFKESFVASLAAERESAAVAATAAVAAEAGE